MGIVAVLFIALTLVFIQNYEVHRVNVCAVGDILLYRGVRDRLIENGYDYPYERVKHILKKADIAFGNLECPFLLRYVILLFWWMMLLASLIEHYFYPRMNAVITITAAVIVITGTVIRAVSLEPWIDFFLLI